MRKYPSESYDNEEYVPHNISYGSSLFRKKWEIPDITSNGVPNPVHPNESETKKEDMEFIFE